MVTKKYVPIVLVTGLLACAGCGSTKELSTISADERFAAAKALFDKQDYLEAITKFRSITLQFPGSAVADDAQYYLGESHFRRGEYLLAAYEYGELKRNMPASPLVPEAAFRLGESYYMLSPRSNLDQEYTRKAIDELQSFVDYYPSNDHAPRAAEIIKELNERLARKAYDTATLYITMEYYRAAVFYFDDVIEKYHDTQYAPLAYLGKTQALMARRKYKDALEEITHFLSLFPNSVLRSRADALRRDIEDDLQKGIPDDGKEPGAQALPGTEGRLSTSSGPP